MCQSKGKQGHCHFGSAGWHRHASAVLLMVRRSHPVQDVSAHVGLCNEQVVCVGHAAWNIVTVQHVERISIKTPAQHTVKAACSCHGTTREHVK